jgi:hypothetical protein
MNKQTPEPMEPAAHMYPSDLERFSRCETSAVAFSVAVGNPDERSVPLFTAEQVISLRASRDELLSALKDVLVMWKSPQPTKLDEALSWRQNDINAEAAARAAISRAAATGQPEQPK